MEYVWLVEGDHTLKVQYRRLSDAGDWNNALVYEEQFYLSPNREGVAPCDGRSGVEIASSSDCILLTQSFSQLDVIGWADKNDLLARVNGPYEARLYDDGDYQGKPIIVRPNENIPAGNNVSSIQLRPAVACALSVASGNTNALVTAINTANTSTTPQTICLEAGTYLLPNS